MRIAVVILAFTLAAPLAAQTAHEDLTAIADNSFLLEEAYNQDPGVVQHISVFTHDDDSWEFALTQEWPLRGVRHQFSYEIPVNGNGSTELGDVAINYRYQLRGDPESDLAIAPRLTVVLPTNDDSSSASWEAAIPISRIYTPRVAGHTNIGVDDHRTVTIGQSFIYAPSSRVHMLIEGVYERPDDGDSTFVINPGVRWAYNRPSGLQIVPGISVPIGAGRSAGSNAILLYLSFEHPFR